MPPQPIRRLAIPGDSPGTFIVSSILWIGERRLSPQPPQPIRRLAIPGKAPHFYRILDPQDRGASFKPATTAANTKIGDPGKAAVSAALTQRIFLTAA
ncbi:hypothetical protein QEH52_17425 [Coraliomargarita sp. SDUM461003]|uniref:Uncharacterized protein n=1 Tax=Thalassobacterium maritimum TaxID=3041265 RepID=A0ABU1B079_9BACT|nr:hypothetical protein [Coraliomargarita sp. SDUM461003]MDQ8209312.1 hypothetical protein [Coraliomargarita sp. SDUM461003]